MAPFGGALTPGRRGGNLAGRMSMRRARRFARYLVLGLCWGLGWVRLCAQGGIEPEDKATDKFMGNPDERVERAEREQAVRQAYAQYQAAGNGEDLVFDRLFAPRLYDESFDTELPATAMKGQWDLIIDPSFGDFISDDHVRFDVGTRYAFSSYFQAYTELGTYFENPFGEGESSGLYNLHVGGKYTWRTVLDTPYNLAAGLEVNMPVSEPPRELTDGWGRYTPFVAISREIRDDPATLGYVNVAYEAVEESPFDTPPLVWKPQDRLFLRPGVVYYPGGRFRYSLELEYRTTRLSFEDGPVPLVAVPPGAPEHADYVRAFEDYDELLAYPGVTWFPTREFRDGLIIPGNWDVGVKLTVPIVQETDEDFGVTVRFRWFYDYRDFVLKNLTHLRNGNNSHP